MGFNEFKWCLWVILVSGLVWFINWDNWFELKNFWKIVDKICVWINEFKEFNVFGVFCKIFLLLIWL